MPIVIGFSLGAIESPNVCMSLPLSCKIFPEKPVYLNANVALVHLAITHLSSNQLYLI
jgi:hypothetical protein